MAGRSEIQWREPTEDERILLNLAVHALPETVRGEYERQLEGIKVRFNCTCGCPSLELYPDKQTPSAAATRSPQDAGWAFFDDESGPCDLLLFIREGRLLTLELVCYVGNPGPGARLVKVTEDSTEKVILYERAGA